MTAAVKRRAIFTEARTMADGGIKMAFVTAMEQSGGDLAQLFDLKGKECDLYLVEPDAPLNPTDEAPAYQKTNPARPKTPSQALRQELWAYFGAIGYDGSFDDFYERIIDEYIRHWHDKRMERPL